jgi:general stress protein 26
MTADRILEVSRDTIDAAKFCFLITVNPAGHANARVMQAFGPEEDLTFWFGVGRTSRKVQEIERDPRVTLAFLHPPEGAYLSILGEATLERDPDLRRKHWRELFFEFWPDGPQGDDYALLRFVPSRIELMNIEKGVAPDPFGLRPAVIARTEAGWEISRGDYDT